VTGSGLAEALDAAATDDVATAVQVGNGWGGYPLAVN
jgi:hypothetical protein